MKVPFQNFGRSAEGPLGERLLAAAARVLRSGHYVLGPEVKHFEEDFGSRLGAAFVVGVASGLDALTIGLRAQGVGPGDEVITTPLSAAATALAITHVGATPVFVDVEADTLCLDAARAEAAVGPKTKAIVVVHLYGVPANLAALLEVCRRTGVALVEDCAQAHLAEYGGRPVGTLGRWSAFSFYPTKNLGAVGDAGAIVTSDQHLARACRELRDYGQRAKYEHVRIGYNSRLDELQAALLTVKLAQLAEWNERRAAIASTYRAGLRELPLQLPGVTESSKPAWHLFAVRTGDRDALIRHLDSASISSGIHYPRVIPDQECYRSEGMCRSADALVEARQAAKKTVSLPLYPELGDDELAWVIDRVRAFYG